MFAPSATFSASLNYNIFEFDRCTIKLDEVDTDIVLRQYSNHKGFRMQKFHNKTVIFVLESERNFVVEAKIFKYKFNNLGKFDSCNFQIMFRQR